MGSIYLTNQLDTLRITSKLWSKSAYLEDSQKNYKPLKHFLVQIQTLRSIPSFLLLPENWMKTRKSSV